MGKEKILHKKETKNNFYTVIGVFLILFSLIIIGGIGNLGLKLKILSKIIFGDYTFLVYVLLIILGIRGIIKHLYINIHSRVFMGSVLIICGLLTLSHLTILDNITSSGIIKNTFKLYKNYFNNYNSSYIFGGGIIGAFSLEILFFFFGKIGSIVFSIIFILLGVSFISNNILEIFLKTIKFIKKYGFLIVKQVVKFLRGFSIKDGIKPIIFKNIDLNILNDIKPSINVKIQESVSKDNYIVLFKELNKYGVVGLYYNLGYKYTSYFFKGSINIEYISDILRKLNMKGFFYNSNGYTKIEVLNQFMELFTLKKALINNNDKFLIPLGSISFNDYQYLDLNKYGYFVICGDKGSGIRNYIKSLVSSISIKSNDDFKIYVIDTLGDLLFLDVISKYIKYELSILRGYELLDELCNIIERRKEIYDYLGCENFMEANKMIIEKDLNIDEITPLYLFINVNIKKSNQDFYNKLDYLVKYGFSYQIYIFIMTRTREYLADISINKAYKIGFYTNSMELSYRLFNSNILASLYDKGDFIATDGLNLYHGQSPFISDGDFNKIMKKL